MGFVELPDRFISWKQVWAKVVELKLENSFTIRIPSLAYGIEEYKISEVKDALLSELLADDERFREQVKDLMSACNKFVGVLQSPYERQEFNKVSSRVLLLKDSKDNYLG